MSIFQLLYKAKVKSNPAVLFTEQGTNEKCNESQVWASLLEEKTTETQTNRVETKHHEGKSYYDLDTWA